jgi:hypothetical protein
MKMAHFATQVARYDTERSVRKVKFQLPATLGKERYHQDIDLTYNSWSIMC